MNRIAIIAIFTLSGCAANPHHWDGNTDRQYYKDSSQCHAISATPQSQQPAYIPPGKTNSFSNGMNTGFLNGYSMAAAMNATKKSGTIYDHCMKGKGYTLKKGEGKNPERTISRWLLQKLL